MPVHGNTHLIIPSFFASLWPEQVTTTNIVPSPPSIESASFVETVETDDDKSFVRMVVYGVNFNRYFTKLYFDPPVYGYALQELKVR